MTDDLPTGLTLPERIMVARLRAKLEQTEVAARTGLSRVSISNYERGATKPQPTAFPLLAAALGVPVEWLRGG